MIKAEKHDPALRALNAVLVWARTLAYEKATHERLAAVLDIAEQMPMLFLEKNDATDYYRSILVDLQASFGFSVALQRFDEEI
jgi:hypothetical protein